MNTQHIYRDPNPTHKEPVEMNTQPAPDSAKERTIRALAILGVIGLVVLIAFIIIHVVSFIPTMFQSLTGMMQTQSDPAIQIEITDDSIASGDTTTINWTSAGDIASYGFSFSCSEEALQSEIRTDEYGTQSLSCDTEYNLDQITTLDLTVYADNARFNTLNYTVYGYSSDSTTDSASANGSIEIFNRAISIGGSNSGDTSSQTDQDEETSPETDQIEEEITVEPTPQAAPPTPEYTYQEVYVYDIPTSDPNGYTDLSLTYRGVGRLNGTNYIPAQAFSTDETGAIKFSIKNTGSRTSSSWTYTAQLPNNTTYTSPAQTPLKPNEEAHITLGFRPASEADTYPFSVSVDTARDTSNSNNSFSWSVTTTR